MAGLYALTHDITEQKVVQRQLEALARIDSLTGLANRRQFEERVAEAMARSGVSIGVLLHRHRPLKAVNDSR